MDILSQSGSRRENAGLRQERPGIGRYSVQSRDGWAVAVTVERRHDEGRPLGCDLDVRNAWLLGRRRRRFMGRLVECRVHLFAIGAAILAARAAYLEC